MLQFSSNRLGDALRDWALFHPGPIIHCHEAQFTVAGDNVPALGDGLAERHILYFRQKLGGGAGSD